MSSHDLGMPGPPPRSRGLIALREANCTVCMICVRECPDWCITIEGHAEHAAGAGAGAGAGAEPEAGAPARRPRSTTMLDRFDIDFGLCMYCGICIETCPFDALFWAPAVVPPGSGPTDLLAARGTLAAWDAEVPEPEPLDAGAEVEEVSARRRARGQA
jgi:NADH-quinone oxidoreductase subunit I